MKQFDLSNLPEDLLGCTEELFDTLRLSFGGGVPLIAEKSELLEVSYDGWRVVIGYPTLPAFFRGLLLLKQNFTGRAFHVSQTCFLKELGIMLDCSRNAVRSVAHVKEIIRHLALMGYNQLQLYTEDTYEIEGEPYFGHMRGRYTAAELKELDAYAGRFGIELVPCIQTLAHLNQIFRWDNYAPVNDVEDILLVGEEKTYELIEKMIRTCAECFHSRKIHIGMDEAHLLGRGKYEDLHGATERRSELMLAHLKRVVELVRKYGFQPMMWSDMFFRFAANGQYYGNIEISPSVAALVPEDVSLVYWDYYNRSSEVYETMLQSHLKFNREVVFAGGAWIWRGFAPANRFSIEIIKTALGACKDKGIERAFFTMWGDDGAECSALSALPALVTAAECAYGVSDAEGSFKSLTGVSLSDFMLLEAGNHVSDKEETVHYECLSKILLYNNPIGGLFDGYAEKGQNAAYARCAAELRAAEKRAGRYAYLFCTQRRLAEVLKYKAEIGIRAREAYRAGDVEKLSELAEGDYKKLIAALKAFYRAFEEQWSRENKPFGFEVQDYRLGGLLLRVEHCRARLISYVKGETECIPELEEEVLVAGSRIYNSYLKTATANVM